MLDIIKRFFSQDTLDDAAENTPDAAHDRLVATCALFVEIARIDDEFTDAEMEKIISILQTSYGLSREHADALIATAEKQLADSVDLWQFARLINQNYTADEKIEIVETLWRIVYVDGKMDAHEHYLMGKLQNLLRLSHDQLIQAKLKVKYDS